MKSWIGPITTGGIVATAIMYGAWAAAFIAFYIEYF